jgi:hypothetical protein
MPQLEERRLKPSTPARSHRTSRWAQRAGALQALTTLTLLCAFGYVAWSIGWSRGSVLGLSRAALVGVGVLIVGLSLLVVIQLVRRLSRRADHRFAVEIQGRVGDEIVAVLDLFRTGLVFGSSVEWPLGARARLLTRLVAGSGALRDTALELLVTSCSYDEPNARFRVVAELVDLDDATQNLIVEYCYVYKPLDRVVSAPRSPPEPPAGAGELATG